MKAAGIIIGVILIGGLGLFIRELGAFVDDMMPKD